MSLDTNDKTVDLAAIAISIADYVYKIRISSEIQVKEDEELFQCFNNWVHTTGIVIPDPKDAIWAYKHMRSMFSLPLKALKYALDEDLKRQGT